MQAYYLLTFSCTAFVAPYMNIYFKRLGFSEDAIGLLSAVRPWVSAASGAHAPAVVPAVAVLSLHLHAVAGTLLLLQTHRACTGGLLRNNSRMAVVSACASFSPPVLTRPVGCVRQAACGRRWRTRRRGTAG